MENIIKVIQDTALFKNISASNISTLLNCVSARIKYYKKDEFILHSGDIINTLGIVIEGRILIIKEDFWGNRSIISEITKGNSFAETYAILPNIPLEISVMASSDCSILFLEINKLLQVCDSSCSFHSSLIKDLLIDVASKNLILTRKIEHMSQKTIREKVLSYLSLESQKNKSESFNIPYNRQQLADYLSVDRSALSNELSKLSQEGIIYFKKDKFTLFDK